MFMILKTYYFYLWFPNKIQLHIIDQIKVLRVTIIYALIVSATKNLTIEKTRNINR